MEKYKCDLCDKNHHFFYRSESPLPPNIYKIVNNDTENRIDSLGDLAYVLDKKRLIIKGSLQISLDFDDGVIEHFVWMNIPLPQFSDNLNNLEAGEEVELEGVIISDLPFFEDLIDSEAKLFMHRSKACGQIKITSENQIKKDQESPISKERLIQISQRINHPELWKDKKTFEDGFKVRFNEILKTAKTDYIEKEKAFVIDISNQREGLLQLIASELLKESSDIGIRLHLSNDDINTDYKNVQIKMDEISKSTGINKVVIDKIETYQKSYALNDKTLFKEIKYIIETVFEENLDELELDIFEV